MKIARTNEIRFDGRAISIPQTDAIPVSSANVEIHHEVLLEISDAWHGLNVCAKVFRDSGFCCVSMRYSMGGAVYFRLKDNGKADLKLLEANFCQHQEVRLQSWTTVISSVKPGLQGA